MLTSCSWDSFFLEDKFKCFSRTPQYFSVSLSYFFLASYKTEQTAQCCAPRHRASARRLHGTPSTRDPRLGAAHPLLSPSSTGAAPGAWARVNARDLGPGEAPLAGRAAREVTPVPGPCSLPIPGQRLTPGVIGRTPRLGWLWEADVSPALALGKARARQGSWGYFKFVLKSDSSPAATPRAGRL